MENRLRGLKPSARCLYWYTLSRGGKPDFPQQYRAKCSFWTETTALISSENFTAHSQAVLQLCQLTDVAEAHPLDLYAAQRRMVAVANLEEMAPPVLLLNEPSWDFDAHRLTSI